MSKTVFYPSVMSIPHALALLTSYTPLLQRSAGAQNDQEFGACATQLIIHLRPKNINAYPQLINNE